MTEEKNEENTEFKRVVSEDGQHVHCLLACIKFTGTPKAFCFFSC